MTYTYENHWKICLLDVNTDMLMWYMFTTETFFEIYYFVGFAFVNFSNK